MHVEAHSLLVFSKGRHPEGGKGIIRGGAYRRTTSSGTFKVLRCAENHYDIMAV
jgi:hypothetical protein